MPNRSRDQLVRRIQSEYLEMPGLHLTRKQAQRLWALDDETCVAVLEVLVDQRFLVCGSDGRYRRLTDGREPARPLRMAKADTKTPAKSSRAR